MKIGVAHEYGFSSVPELPIDKYDSGYLVILFTMLSMLASGLFCFSRGGGLFLHYLVFACWFASLFPITGIIPTGTFIAERLIYASTVAVAIYGGRLLTSVIVVRSNDGLNIDITQTSFRVMLLLLVSRNVYLGVHDRICDWCDSTSLLRTTLRTFPNNALSLYDLAIRTVKLGIDHNVDEARELLERSLDVIPSFCRCQFPLAVIADMQGRILEKERHTIEAILCSTTNQDANNFFTKHWKDVLVYAQSIDENTFNIHMKRYKEQIAELKVRHERDGIVKED